MSRSSTRRAALLLRDVDVTTMAGLEIGALDRPTVTPAAGNIRFADYRTTEELRRHYASQPWIAPQAIVDVDIVLGARSLPDVLADQPRFDYVVASHVIEHVPDVIGWLQQISAILKPGGRLCLAIPDKRYSFDYLGPLSSFGDLVDAHLSQRTAPSVKQVYEFYRSAADVSVVRAWLGLVDARRLSHWSTAEGALQKCRELQAGASLEVHCFRFTPQSFATIFDELLVHELTDFRIARFSETAPFELEFFVSLEKLATRDRAAQCASVPRLRARVPRRRVLYVLVAKATRKLAGCLRQAVWG